MDSESGDWRENLSLFEIEKYLPENFNVLVYTERQLNRKQV